MKKIVIVMVSILYLSCNQINVVADAVVEGKFTLSPLCGVQPAILTTANPCGLSDADMDTIYGQYKVQILDAVTSKVVLEKKMDRTGLYSFTVPAGSYKVDYQPHTNYQGSSNALPSAFTLMSGQHLTVNLSIDTGIR